jgi:hypothetical protein
VVEVRIAAERAYADTSACALLARLRRRLPRSR